MKRRTLREYTRRAIACTVVHVDDRDRKSPTWNGRTLHIARIKSEAHVLHEIAHWITAIPRHRALPNYGLGADPDGGPRTETFHFSDVNGGHIDDEALTSLVHLARLAPEALATALQAGLSYQEELASVVTIILMRLAGLPWKGEMKRVFACVLREDGAHLGRFWQMVASLAEHGVDLEDPIRPFASRGKAAA